MKTVAVQVRVFGPENTLTAGITVTARLQTVGITPSGIGFVDRTFESAVTDEIGECTLTLWPSIEGSTGAEYQIVARNPDGSKLFDELVSVPDVDFPIWLHDIILLPPPSTKNYDVEAIKVIIDAKVNAMHARDEAVQAALDAQAAVAQAEANAAAAAASAGEASASAVIAADSADESAVSAAAAAASAAAALASELAAKTAETAALGHANDAKAEADRIAGDVASLDGRITDTDVRVTTLEGKVEALEAGGGSGGSGQDSRLDDVSVDGWTLIKAANFEAMSELLGDTAATEAAIAQANQTAQAALDKANEAKAAVDAAEVSTLPAKVDAMEVRLATAETDISALKSQGGGSGSGASPSDFLLKSTALPHEGWLGAGKHLAETYPNISNLFGDLVYQVSINPLNFTDSGSGEATYASRKVYAARSFGESQALLFETKIRIVTNGFEQEFAKDVNLTGLSASNKYIANFAPADYSLPIKLYVSNGTTFEEVSVTNPVQDYVLGVITLGGAEYLAYRQTGKLVRLDSNHAPVGSPLETNMTNLSFVCSSRNGRVFSSINAYDTEEATWFPSLYELVGQTWSKIFTKSGSTSISCEKGSDVVYFNDGKSWYDTVTSTFGSTVIPGDQAQITSLFAGLNDLLFCYTNINGCIFSTDRGLTFTAQGDLNFISGVPTSASLEEQALRIYGNPGASEDESTTTNTRFWPLAQGSAFFKVPLIPSPVPDFAYYVKT